MHATVGTTPHSTAARMTEQYSDPLVEERVPQAGHLSCCSLQERTALIAFTAITAIVSIFIVPIVPALILTAAFVLPVSLCYLVFKGIFQSSSTSFVQGASGRGGTNWFVHRTPHRTAAAPYGSFGRGNSTRLDRPEVLSAPRIVYPPPRRAEDDLTHTRLQMRLSSQERPPVGKSEHSRAFTSYSGVSTSRDREMPGPALQATGLVQRAQVGIGAPLRGFAGDPSSFKQTDTYS